MSASTAQITGIIAEYNPFHNGHLYQMRKARSLTGASWCVVLLSGHFVQRGEAAVYSTAARAEAALRCGADAVFEIPAPFSTASAREYASYGVRLLSALGVPYMACGTEDATAEELMLLAEASDETSAAFRHALKEALRSGLTYPEARIRAMTADLSAAGAEDPVLFRIRQLLSQPNNILAYEYARAIRENGAEIRLVTSERKGSGYHDPILRGSFSSATSIRKKILEEGDLSELTGYIPSSAMHVFSGTLPLDPDALCAPLRNRIASLRWDGQDLDEFADVAPDLAERLSGLDLRFSTWNELVNAVKTRQYTHTRISRALIHILLGITKNDMEHWKYSSSAPCARLLGFRQESVGLFSVLKTTSSIPIISKAADASAVLGEDSPSLLLMEAEAHAHELWNSAYFDRCGIRLPDYYRSPVVIV